MMRKSIYNLLEDDHSHGSTQANREGYVCLFSALFQARWGVQMIKKWKSFQKIELTITEHGQVVTDLKSKTVFDLNLELIGQKDTMVGRDWRYKRISVRNNRKAVRTNIIIKAIYTGQISRETYVIHKYFIEGWPPVPFLVIQPASK